MKVKELIATLSGFDPNLDVFCYTEDNEDSRVLEIMDVKENEGERTRGSDGLPAIKFGKGKLAQKFVLLEVTTEA